MVRNVVALFFSLLLSILNTQAQENWFTLDMVHNNPGEPPTQTQFIQPETLKYP